MLFFGANDRRIYDELPAIGKRDSHIFNTFFYKRLTSKASDGKTTAGWNAVRKWTKKGNGVDLFEKKFIVVPINESLHWYVAVIVNLDKCVLGSDVSNADTLSKVAELDGTDAPNEQTSCQPDDFKAKGVDLDLDRLSSMYVSRSETPSEQQIIDPFPTEKSAFELIPDSQEILGDATSSHAIQGSLRSALNCGSPVSQTTIMEGVPDLSVSFLPESSSQVELQDVCDIPVISQHAETLQRQDIDNEESAIQDDNMTNAFRKNFKHEDSSSSRLYSSRKTYAKISQKTDESEPVIILFDSLGGRHNPVYKRLRDYLIAEAAATEGLTVDVKKIQTCSAEVPQQSNSTDCGLYLLQYVKQLLIQPDMLVKDALTKVSSPDKAGKSMHQRSKEVIWNVDQIKFRREEMRKEILDLSESYKHFKAAQSSTASAASVVSTVTSAAPVNVNGMPAALSTTSPKNDDQDASLNSSSVGKDDIDMLTRDVM